MEEFRRNIYGEVLLYEEYNIILKNGSIIPVISYPRPFMKTAYRWDTCVLLEISRQKDLEHALSQERLRFSFLWMSPAS
jgi:hypothetical protein